MGAGFSRDWYLKACRQAAVPAPRIEYPQSAVTARWFWRVARNGVTPASSIDPAGFGIRAKTHPARRALLGNVDQAFCDGPDWLPSDFDFAIWNCAPADQQVAFLDGDETIELANLSAPEVAGASVDVAGNVRLRLALPGNECFVLLRYDSDELAAVPMHLDTLIVEPDALEVTVVWRLRLEKRPDLRVCEARMRPIAERRQLDELKRAVARPEERTPA